jgi:hypothetical protein
MFVVIWEEKNQELQGKELKNLEEAKSFPFCAQNFRLNSVRTDLVSQYNIAKTLGNEERKIGKTKQLILRWKTSKKNIVFFARFCLVYAENIE